MRIWTLLLMGSALSFAAACEPTSTANSGSGGSVTITETPSPEIIETVSSELVTPAYRGRLEFLDSSGRVVTLSPPLTTGFLDQLRDMDFNAASINAIVEQASASVDMMNVVEVRGYSEIVGLTAGQTDVKMGTLLHSGLVFVKRGNTLMGFNHGLDWDSTSEVLTLNVTPVGFTPSDMTILSRKNVREDVASGDLAALPGAWTPEGYAAVNRADGDQSFHYTLIRVTDPATGEVLDFHGPDNFQTYR